MKKILLFSLFLAILYEGANAQIQFRSVVPGKPEHLVVWSNVAKVFFEEPISANPSVLSLYSGQTTVYEAPFKLRDFTDGVNLGDVAIEFREDPYDGYFYAELSTYGKVGDESCSNKLPAGHQVGVVIPAEIFQNNAGDKWPSSATTVYVNNDNSSKPTVDLQVKTTQFVVTGNREFVEDYDVTYNLIFDELVVPGTGTITFRNLEDNSRSVTISASDAEYVKFVETECNNPFSYVELRPPFLYSDAAIDYDRYELEIESTAFKNLRGAGQPLAQNYVTQFDVWKQVPEQFGINTMTNSIAYIQEHRPLGSEVGTFEADFGNGIMLYKMTTNPAYPDNQYFYTNNGTLRTAVLASALDFETKDEYTIEVEALHKNSGFGITKEITVRLQDLNPESPNIVSKDPPTSLLGLPLALDPAKYMSVLTMKFDRPVALGSGNITVWTVGSPFSTIRETIDVQGGQVTVYQDSTVRIHLSANLATYTEYRVTVPDGAVVGFTGFSGTDWQFTSSRGPLGTATGPNDIFLSNTTVHESKGGYGVYELIGSLTASDPNQLAGQPFNYYFTNTGQSTDATGKFQITSFLNNFSLVTTGLDYEEQSMYSLDITVEDVEGKTFSKSFAIEVIDGANEPPTDLFLQTGLIMEGNDIGDPIGLLIAEDDSSDTHTYSLYPGTGDDDNAKFTIDNDTLKANHVIDYATQYEFSIYVLVTDQGGLRYGKSLTINALAGWNNSSALALTQMAQTITVTDPDTIEYPANGYYIMDAEATSGFYIGYHLQDGAGFMNEDTIKNLMPGNYQVGMEQSGNYVWASVTDVVDFYVKKKTQEILFTTMPDRLTTDTPFVLTASASSNLPLSVQDLSGPVTYDSVSQMFTLTGDTGMVSFTIVQEGDDLYAPGLSISASFNVTAEEEEQVTDGIAEDVQTLVVYPNPTKGMVVLGQELTYQVYAPSGRKILSGKGSSINIEEYPNGVYYIVTLNGATRIIKE